MCCVFHHRHTCGKVPSGRHSVHALRQSELTVRQVIWGHELFLEFSAYYLRTTADLGHQPHEVALWRMVNFSFWPTDFSAPGLSIGSLHPLLFLYCISLSAWGVSGDAVCAQSRPCGWNYFLSVDVCKHRLHICLERTLRNPQALTRGCGESGN